MTHANASLQVIMANERRTSQSSYVNAERSFQHAIRQHFAAKPVAHADLHPVRSRFRVVRVGALCSRCSRWRNLKATRAKLGSTLVIDPLSFGCVHRVSWQDFRSKDIGVVSMCRIDASSQPVS